MVLLLAFAFDAKLRDGDIERCHEERLCANFSCEKFQFAVG